MYLWINNITSNRASANMTILDMLALALASSFELVSRAEERQVQ